jgi:hypothetical protein
METGWILDQATQLFWWDQGTLATWSEALQTCDDLVAGAWRLATREDLLSLIDYGLSEPASRFPNLAPVEFWTQVSMAADDSLAWAVSFADGRATAVEKATTLSVLCVRTRSSE